MKLVTAGVTRNTPRAALLASEHNKWMAVCRLVIGRPHADAHGPIWDEDFF